MVAMIAVMMVVMTICSDCGGDCRDAQVGDRAPSSQPSIGYSESRIALPMCVPANP